LRWRASNPRAWAGAYADSAFGSQFRTGADTSLQVAKYLQLQPSVQLATRGFVGGSLNVQVGVRRNNNIAPQTTIPLTSLSTEYQHWTLPQSEIHDPDTADVSAS
jgi:hypothetical protein